MDQEKQIKQIIPMPCGYPDVILSTTAQQSTAFAIQVTPLFSHTQASFAGFLSLKLPAGLEFQGSLF